MLRVAPQTLYDDFAAGDALDIMDRAGQIPVPALVICGLEDRLTPPKYSSYLAENIIGAALRWIEGAGHMVMVEKPEHVAKAVQAALHTGQL